MDGGQVVEKILSDAGAEAAKIKAAADEQLASERSVLNAELDSYKKETAELAEKKGEEKKSHLLAAARMEIAKEFLAEKKSILDEVFDKARGRLQNLGDDDYCKMMTRLIIEAVESGDEEVIVDKNETRIDPNFIRQVNRQLGPGSMGNLRLSDERLDIGAGFILRRGKIKNNASLDILLAQGRKELEIDLAKELFS